MLLPRIRLSMIVWGEIFKVKSQQVVAVFGDGEIVWGEIFKVKSQPIFVLFVVVVYCMGGDF